MEIQIILALAALGCCTGFLAGLLGIGGGMVGRIFNKKMDNKAVDKLFLCLMGVIIAISVYNTIKYLG